MVVKSEWKDVLEKILDRVTAFERKRSKETGVPRVEAPQTDTDFCSGTSKLGEKKE